MLDARVEAASRESQSWRTLKNSERPMTNSVDNPIILVTQQGFDGRQGDVDGATEDGQREEESQGSQ